MLPQAQRTAAPFVGAYMTAHPITVDAAAPVAEAAALLRSCRVRHLPVLDETKLVGVISVRDVIGADERRRVAELVPRDLVTAEPGWTVDTACEQLIERHLSCLPMVDA